MALSDTALRNAKPAGKPYKLYDERGLYLIVNPSGDNTKGHSRRLDYFNVS